MDSQALDPLRLGQSDLLEVPRGPGLGPGHKLVLGDGKRCMQASTTQYQVPWLSC
jgi:hypothetical protein